MNTGKRRGILKRLMTHTAPATTQTYDRGIRNKRVFGVCNDSLYLDSSFFSPSVEEVS